MARKIKNLSVKTREYKDRDGNSKAGIPDFSGKENSGSIMVNMFDSDNDYQPSRKDIPPSYKGNDNDIPF